MLRKYRRKYVYPSCCFIAAMLLNYVVTQYEIDTIIEDQRPLFNTQSDQIADEINNEINGLLNTLATLDIRNSNSNSTILDYINNYEAVYRYGTIYEYGEFTGYKKTPNQEAEFLDKSINKLLIKTCENQQDTVYVRKPILNICISSNPKSIFTILTVDIRKLNSVKNSQPAHNVSQLIIDSLKAKNTDFQLINLFNTTLISKEKPITIDKKSYVFNFQLKAIHSIYNEFIIKNLFIFTLLGSLAYLILFLTYKEKYNQTVNEHKNKLLIRHLKSTQKQNNFLDIISNTLAIGGFIYHTKTDKVEVTKGIREIFEIAPDHDDWNQYLACFDTDEQSYISDSISSLSPDKKHWKIETTISLKNKMKWIAINCSYREEDDSPIIIGAVQDITNEKQADIYLAQTSIELEQQTYALNNHAIVTIVDKLGIMIHANQKFYNICGYSENEVIGHDCKEFFSLTNGNKGWQEIEDTLFSGKLFQGEFLNKNKKGQHYWLQSTIVPYSNNNSDYDSFVSISTDISDTKNAENENQRLQNQLIQAQKMEVVGQLTGGIAHDFNNILASIIGYSNLASTQIGQYEDKKLNKYLEQINLSSQRARDLIKKMLDFSRPSEHEPTLINLKTELNQLLLTLTPLIPKDIVLKTNINEIETIYFDKVQLQQLIMNLVVNARDAILEHSNTGEIRIDFTPYYANHDICSSCHTLINENYIAVSISDNGNGIDEKTIEKIFEPFYTTKEVGKGTGMGLSIIHGIIHKIGGHLLCKSVIGEGTTFTILMPKKSQKPKNSTIAFYQTNAIKKLKIAVIDDEENILDILFDGLESYGHSVAIFTDPFEFSQHKPDEPSHMFDIIITDLNMPNISGLNFLKTLRNNGYSCPIIAMSGYNKDINASNFSSFSFDGFIAKPFTIIEIEKKITDITQKNKGDLHE